MRKGTAAEWVAANTVLEAGEVGVETDTGKFKIGRSPTVAWNSLDYAVGDIPTDVSDLLDASGIIPVDLADLADVSTTPPNDGEVLKWNAGTSKWEPSVDATSTGGDGATYTISAETELGGAKIRLTGSDASTDDVSIVGSGAITVTRDTASQITIDADPIVTYGIETSLDPSGVNFTLAGSDTTQDTILFSAGSGIGISRPDATTIEFSSLASDTTYTFEGQTDVAGAKLVLTDSNAIANEVVLEAGINIDINQVSAGTIAIAAAEYNLSAGTEVGGGGKTLGTFTLTNTQTSVDRKVNVLAGNNIFITAATDGFSIATDSGKVNSGTANRLAMYYSTGNQVVESNANLTYTPTSSTLSTQNLYIIRDTYTGLPGAGLTIAQSHETADAVNTTWTRSRGTNAAPTTLSSGDRIADLTFVGYAGVAGAGGGYANGAIITASVNGTPTTGSVPTQLTFSVTNSGGGSVTPRAVLTPAGVWRVDTIQPLSTADLTFSTPTGIVKLPAGSTVGGVPIGAITITGSVSTSASLPSQPVTAGVAYVVTTPSPSHLWVSDGSAWVDLGAFQGPTGANGTNGADGVGIPAGGAVGEFLVKSTVTDYDTAWQALADVALSGAYADLSGTPTLATVATSGAYADLSGTPTLATVATSGAYADLSGTPTLATVATSGDYDDLINQPTIPAAQINSDWSATTGLAQILNKPTLATVATSGDYDDLINQPTIPVNLADLADVDATAPSTGQVLKWSGTAWAPAADNEGTGGSASNSFATISVSGQTDVVADSSTDTLTLVAGSGISISTNATTDTITITATGGGGGSMASRTTVSGTTSSLSAGGTGPINITGYKGYMLMKVETSAAAWVRIYTSEAARIADASRTEGTDPSPGAGVIAEVITTGADTVMITPGALGFNDDPTVTTDIPVRVTNKSGSSTTITVTLTVIQLEA